MTETKRMGFGKNVGHPHKKGLGQLLDKTLEKGVVIDVRIRSFLYGIRLIGIRAKIMLANFEQAPNLGLILPEGADMNAPGWKELAKDQCPLCNKRVGAEEMRGGCPWCGYRVGGFNDR